MRFLLAGALAALTAALLAAIPPDVPSDEERAAARAIRPIQLSSDALFLSRAGTTLGDRAAHAYVASRFEAIGLEPATAGGSWELLRGRADGPVLAHLPGRDPRLRGESLLVVPGSDSAHAVAALLAVAEAFAALPARPRRAVVFHALGDGREATVPGTRVAARLALGAADSEDPWAAGEARRVFELGVRLANAPGASDAPPPDARADAPRAAFAARER